MDYVAFAQARHAQQAPVITLLETIQECGGGSPLNPAIGPNVPSLREMGEHMKWASKLDTESDGGGMTVHGGHSGMGKAFIKPPTPGHEH